MIRKYLEQNVLSQKIWIGYNIELAELVYWVEQLAEWVYFWSNEQNSKGF